MNPFGGFPNDCYHNLINIIPFILESNGKFVVDTTGTARYAEF